MLLVLWLALFLRFIFIRDANFLLLVVGSIKVPIDVHHFFAKDF
jgi:hypothetical protein